MLCRNMHIHVFCVCDGLDTIAHMYRQTHRHVPLRCAYFHTVNTCLGMHVAMFVVWVNIYVHMFEQMRVYTHVYRNTHARARDRVSSVLTVVASLRAFPAPLGSCQKGCCCEDSCTTPDKAYCVMHARAVNLCTLVHTHVSCMPFDMSMHQTCIRTQVHTQVQIKVSKTCKCSLHIFCLHRCTPQSCSKLRV